MVSRKCILDSYENPWRHINAGDWDSWLECFAEDCRFANPALAETINGKSELRVLAYRGVSSIVFDEHGLTEDYVGTFDVQAVLKVFSQS